LLKLQTQIQHAQKKITSSGNIAKGLEKDVARQQTTVNNLKKDLVDAQEAEERAAGE
jgi:septal ring factor EnvC (AmiA/AmiB activator)